MNKLAKTLATVSIAAALSLSAVPFSAGAEESTESTVEQVNENNNYAHISVVLGNCGDILLLSDSCDLYQDTYKEYSGNTADLKFGDVIEVGNVCIQESMPGHYVFTKDSYIKYLGNASDYYSTKKLTITKKDIINGFELKDDSGTVYIWHDYGYVISEFGFTSDIDPCKLHVGDVLDCAVEKAQTVVVPVKIISQADFIPSGDANGDGKTDVRDCAYIASLLAKANYNKYSLTDDADFNKDGKVDIRDAAAIAHSVLFVNHKHLSGNKT